MARVAHDEVLGDIDVDRMERVMNVEVDGIRSWARVDLLSRDNLIDHFTRNSPQTHLVRIKGDTPERFEHFAKAARAVMYEPGQTAVPQGYSIEVTSEGAIKLVAPR